jgi:hypothetical protein
VDNGTPPNLNLNATAKNPELLQLTLVSRHKFSIRTNERQEHVSCGSE